MCVFMVSFQRHVLLLGEENQEKVSCKTAVPQDIHGITAKFQIFPITLAYPLPNAHQVLTKQTRPASLLIRVYYCRFIRSVGRH